MKLVVCAFAVFTSSVSAMESWEMQGNAYEHQTAADKFAEIWSQITENTTPHEWFPNTMQQMLNESVLPTVNWVGDTVPFDQFWGKREKFIHTQGAVGAFKFVPQ